MAQQDTILSIYNTEEGQEILAELRSMLADDKYKTEPKFSVDIDSYPDNMMPFVDAHMSYLHKNPKIDRRGYMSNLRIMLAIR